MRGNSKLMFFLAVCAFLLGIAGSASAATITIEADSPYVQNCYPFGGGGSGWTPYMGFIYQNVPAFDLQPGDTLAFDLGSQGVSDIQLQIDMVPTTINGGTTESGSFTTVVTNTQTPANPRGDAIIGNYELQFTVEAPFSFSGGGLIIRFSNPSVSYATDNSCSQVLVCANSSDSSGFFVQRFYEDADGVSPWVTSATGNIGGFQIITGESGPIAIPTTNEWGMICLMLLISGISVYYLRKTNVIA